MYLCVNAFPQMFRYDEITPRGNHCWMTMLSFTPVNPVSCNSVAGNSSTLMTSQNASGFPTSYAKWRCLESLLYNLRARENAPQSAFTS